MFFVAKLGKLRYVCVHFVLGGCDLSSGKIGNLPDFIMFWAGISANVLFYPWLHVFRIVIYLIKSLNEIESKASFF